MTSMHEWDDATDQFAHDVIGYAIERLRHPKDTLWGAHPAAELAAELQHAITPEGVGGNEALRLFRTYPRPRRWPPPCSTWW